MKKRARYDSKKLGKSSSGSEHVYKVRRRFIIFVWLVVCIGIGTAIYFNYSAKNMSDTSAKTITLDTGVTTGNELKDDVAFGPWSPLSY
jgi:hypothetical protein